MPHEGKEWGLRLDPDGKHLEVRQKMLLKGAKRMGHSQEEGQFKLCSEKLDSKFKQK